jgi:exonuclease VII large subunit
MASTKTTGTMRSTTSPQATSRNLHTPGFEEEIRSKMRDVEMTCNRLADDAMEAVEAMQRKMDEVKRTMESAHERKLQEVEQRLSSKMAEGIQRVTTVLKRVVTAQKLQQTQPAQNPQQLKVSGDVSLKMRDPSPVRTGRSPQPAASSSTRTASEPAGRRRRALDELMRELELLEQEERHLI